MSTRMLITEPGRDLSSIVLFGCADWLVQHVGQSVRLLLHVKARTLLSSHDCDSTSNITAKQSNKQRPSVNAIKPAFSEQNTQIVQFISEM